MKQALIITAGTTGSGKTTAADAITRHWPTFRHIEIDAIRKCLAGVTVVRRVESSAGWNSGIYCKTMSDAAYSQIFQQASNLLKEGHPVVLDASFRKRHRRHEAMAIGRLFDLPTLFIHCSLERDEQLRRLQSRYSFGVSASDGRPELLLYHEIGWEPIAPDESENLLRIDTLGPREQVAGEILETVAKALG
jgi:uncharacterized protein